MIRNTQPKSVSLTKAEWEMLKAHAKIKGITVSRLIKMTLLQAGLLEPKKTEEAAA